MVEMHVAINVVVGGRFRPEQRLLLGLHGDVVRYRRGVGGVGMGCRMGLVLRVFGINDRVHWLSVSCSVERI